MDIFEMLKNAITGQQVPDDETVAKTWVQVGKLSPEDDGKRRQINAAAVARRREHDMYAKKMLALKTMNAAESDEWWHHIHKTYGLPEGNYHLHEDGRIFCLPKEPKNEKT